MTQNSDLIVLNVQQSKLGDIKSIFKTTLKVCNHQQNINFMLCLNDSNLSFKTILTKELKQLLSIQNLKYVLLMRNFLRYSKKAKQFFANEEKETVSKLIWVSHGALHTGSWFELCKDVAQEQAITEAHEQFFANYLGLAYALQRKPEGVTQEDLYEYYAQCVKNDESDEDSASEGTDDEVNRNF